MNTRLRTPRCMGAISPLVEDEGALLRLINQRLAAHRPAPAEVRMPPAEVHRMRRACNPFGAAPTFREVLDGVLWHGAQIRGGIRVLPDLDAGPLPEVL